MKNIWIKFLPGIAWFFIVVVLMCIPGNKFPKDDWLDQLYADKIIHVGVFGALAFLFIWPYMQQGISRLRIKAISSVVVILTSIFGLLMEAVQYYFIPNRSFDLMDWVADTLGGLAAWGLIRVIANRRWLEKSR